MRRSGLLAAGAATLILASGCSGGQQAAGSAWPASADLVRTDFLLWGGTGADDVVVDGAGMAWVDGPWEVARVDPATGHATVWDATDDTAFAAVRSIAPAGPEGVWLVSADTARLFDGERFVAVLSLPDGFRDGGEGESPIRDLLQVGSEVWVSGANGVARWADGSWTPMAPDTLVSAGPLAVDSEGAIWAGGAVKPASGKRQNAAVSWDGTTWATPAPGAQTPAGEIEDVAAAPGGGVWVASAREDTDDHGIFRFDGTKWTKVGPGGYARDLSVTTSCQVWATGDNGLWGSGSFSIARLADDGDWQPYREEEGAPRGDELMSLDLAVAGDTVLAAHDGGLDRSQGDPGAERFVSLWDDPAAVIRWPLGTRPDGVLAVGAQEVWMFADVSEHPTNYLASGLVRRRDWEWVRLAQVAGDTPGSPVLASDGAVWAVVDEGLVRIAGDQDETVVDDGFDAGSSPSLAAGPKGSVVAVDHGSVVQVSPRGKRTALGRPKGARGLSSDSALAARDGVVWVASGSIHRWDGAWSTLPELPASNGGTGGTGAAGASQLAAAPDGSLWVIASDEQQVDIGLARFADGTWTMGPRGVRGVAVAPDGAVCTVRVAEADVACYSPSMTLVRTMPVGDPPEALGIAPDGAVWVLGEQVARL